MAARVTLTSLRATDFPAASAAIPNRFAEKRTFLRQLLKQSILLFWEADLWRRSATANAAVAAASAGVSGAIASAGDSLAESQFQSGGGDLAFQDICLALCNQLIYLLLASFQVLYSYLGQDLYFISIYIVFVDDASICKF